MFVYNMLTIKISVLVQSYHFIPRFCACDYLAKNGATALAVWTQLPRAAGEEVTFVCRKRRLKGAKREEAS